MSKSKRNRKWQAAEKVMRQSIRQRKPMLHGFENEELGRLYPTERAITAMTFAIADSTGKSLEDSAIAAVLELMSHGRSVYQEQLQFYDIAQAEVTCFGDDDNPKLSIHYAICDGVLFADLKPWFAY
ncbi:hypothetical protein ETAA8_45610 [Anatilimnocola aggregata]|uniref:Uncharacterized protein n=1 Tax=Anatilimnocola aggregata TaxID=2528021 RepID=A0A517YGZ3_9BACT|nr:hypothetical protein [Anatilimnocola aggregata]QDU29451.1 hypothetical protein ETAA8_45610 [Anatilimnocola aggregata]